MDKRDKIYAAALNALNNVLKINSNDRLLILSDNYSINIADSFKLAAYDKGCKVKVYRIVESNRPLKEIPEELFPMLKDQTVVMNILKALPEEIPFRIKWIFAVEENKNIKCAHMPGITESIMLDGSMDVDYDEMKASAEALKHLLRNAESIKITTGEGTDILLGVKDRAFIDDVNIDAGQMCNLPCGEVYCAPLENRAEGTVVFNACISDVGLLNKPLKVKVHGGKIIKFESEDNGLVRKITKLTDVDADAKIIGELGIGINPGAKITGNMLEDEKVRGTAHIAFGNNADFPGGGKNNSRIHRDFLFYNPTIKVNYADKSSRLIINSGKFLFMY